MIIAGDWWGLQSNDLTTIGRILLSNLDAFAVVPERSAQGVINNLALMRVARVSGMLHDERVFAVDGISVLETERVGESGALQVRNRLYYGCSLGGILGTVYMALSSDVKVATLGVPGGPLALLFPRNDAGSLILSKLLAIHYPNTADRMSILFLMHHL